MCSLIYLKANCTQLIWSLVATERQFTLTNSVQYSSSTDVEKMDSRDSIRRTAQPFSAETFFYLAHLPMKGTCIFRSILTPDSSH